MGHHVSPSFALGRGVRQGSILSPALFLLVMDPLLRQLQSLSLGATVNNMFAGGFMHVDDIRTLAASASTLKTQMSTVTKFTEENFLKLNATKCEIIIFKKSFTGMEEKNLEVSKNSFSMGSEVTCLGYQWRQDLSSTPMVHSKIASRGPGRPSLSLAVPLPFRAS